MSLKLRAEDLIFDHSNWMKTKHTHLSTPTAPVFDHMSLKLSQAAVCLPQITPHFCWSTWASPLRADLYGNSSVVEQINSYHKYLKWQSAALAGRDLLLWPFSVFSFCFFFSPLSLHHQAEGLKEGDYLVAVGDTECKWLGVSDVMKLLKDVDEEGVNIRVVSVLDSSSQPMVTPFVSGFSLPSILWLVEELYLNIPLKKYM